MNIFAVILFGIMTFFPIMMLITNRKNDLSMGQRIDEHNQEAIMSYNYSSDMDVMWLKPDDFLKSKNGGNHPCDFTDKITMVDYKGTFNQKDIQER